MFIFKIRNSFPLEVIYKFQLLLTDTLLANIYTNSEVSSKMFHTYSNIVPHRDVLFDKMH